MADLEFDKGPVLNSWKEIASHLGRGVRTVQRWERDLGMPVRRPRAKSRSAVIAMTDEIDSWLRSSPTSEIIPRHNTNKLRDDLQQSLAEHFELRTRCNLLRAANHQAIAALISNIKTMHETIAMGRISRLPGSAPQRQNAPNKTDILAVNTPNENGNQSPE